MTSREQQDTRYWLTPAGCAAAGEHEPDLDGHHCKVCGAQLGGVA